MSLESIRDDYDLMCQALWDGDVSAASTIARHDAEELKRLKDASGSEIDPQLPGAIKDLGFLAIGANSGANWYHTRHVPIPRIG